MKHGIFKHFNKFYFKMILYHLRKQIRSASFENLTTSIEYTSLELLRDKFCLLVVVGLETLLDNKSEN